jgi:uncharacterized coiled-coil protein SlyX
VIVAGATTDTLEQRIALLEERTAENWTLIDALRADIDALRAAIEAMLPPAR